VPESARWLLTKGRDEEARIVLKKAAKENKVDLPDEMLEKFLGEMKQQEEEDKEKEAVKKAESSFLDLFKHPNLRRKTLLILFLWYYLISFTSQVHCKKLDLPFVGSSTAVPIMDFRGILPIWVATTSSTFSYLALLRFLRTHSCYFL
jgi:hypothetical protein